MVDVSPIIPAGRQVIETYGDGCFRISGTLYRGSVIVLPERTLTWAVASFDELDAAAFAGIDDLDVDILLLGCGTKMHLPSRLLRQGLRERGIVVDAMDTGAACRTYNVLMAEDRRVAAALISVA